MNNWPTWLRRLSQPSPRIVDSLQRQLVQLQLVVLLVFLVLGSAVVVVFAPQSGDAARAYSLGGLTMLVIALCYLISLTVLYRLAAYLLAVVCSVNVLAFALFVDHPEVALAYLSLTILFSVYVLPMRFSVGLAVANGLAVVLLTGAGWLPQDAALQGSSFYLMAATLFLLAGSLRQRDLRRIHANTAALVERESMYRGVVQDQTEMICRIKPDGTVTFTNLAYAQLFDLAPSALTGRNLFALMGRKAAHDLRHNLQSLTPDRTCMVVEEYSTKHNLWYQWTNRAIFAEDGTLSEYQGVGRDITALKSMEEQYRSLVEASPDAILIHDLEGVILFANQAGAKLVGLKAPDEAVGLSVLEFSRTKNHEALRTSLRELVASPSQTATHETHVQRVDGTLRDVEISSSAFNFRGQICIHKVVRDITERKVNERLLQSQQLSLRALYMIAAHPTPDLAERLSYLLQTGVAVLKLEFGMICTLDHDGLRILHSYDPHARLQHPHTDDLNREYCQLAHQGSSVMVVPMEGQPRLQNQLGAYIGLPLVSEGQNIGVLSFASAEPQPPLTDSSIDFVRLMGQWVVTALEREKAAAALAASEHRYRTLIESATDIVYQTDAAGQVTYGNPAMRRFTGYTVEELNTMDAFSVVVEEQRHALRRFYQWQSINRIEQTYYEVQVIAKNGDQRWLGQNVQLVMEGGKFMGYSAIARDITQRRLAEAEREQLIRELDAFAHTVAHDLKNPLALMTGYTSLLADGVEDPAEADHLVEVLRRTTHRMSRIIHEMLRLAEVRSLAEIDLTALDMDAVMDEVAEHLRYMLEQAAVEIVRPTEWPVAVGYAPWVEEVWANYISNAIKYGGRPPRVEVGGTVLDSGYTRFWVRDNGEGLTLDDQHRLFRQFARLQTERVQGHGLGLSIVKRIVERLGGSVGVESNLGRGSTFWFTLPTAPQPTTIVERMPV